VGGVFERGCARDTMARLVRPSSSYDSFDSIDTPSTPSSDESMVVSPHADGIKRIDGGGMDAQVLEKPPARRVSTSGASQRESSPNSMPGHMRGSTAGSEALRPTAFAGDSFWDAPSGQIGAPWQPARSAGHQPGRRASAHLAGEGVEWLAVDDDRGDAWAAPARKRVPQRERTAAADRVFSGRATTNGSKYAHAPAGGGAPGPWGRRWAPPTARERRLAQPARWFAIAAPGRLDMDFRVQVVPLAPRAPPRAPRALVPSCSRVVSESGRECTVGTRVGATVGRGGGRCCAPSRSTRAPAALCCCAAAAAADAPRRAGPAAEAELGPPPPLPPVLIGHASSLLPY
jgi:hypothetical protein